MPSNDGGGNILANYRKSGLPWEAEWAGFLLHICAVQSNVSLSAQKPSCFLNILHGKNNTLEQNHGCNDYTYVEK